MAASSLNLDDLQDATRVEDASLSNTDRQGACIAIKLTDLETTTKIEKYLPYDHRSQPDTLQLITLSIRHPTHGEIGGVSAVRVKHRCYGMFLEIMDVDEELFTISTAIFDKYGELRASFMDNEYHKGSGVWGRELDTGRLVFVLAVSVDPPYWKQGIASWALQRLYDSEHIEKEDKMLCWPSPLPRPPQEQWVAMFLGIVDFFRKAGYRRIGATSFFAYSQDPSHPSRTLDCTEDFDPDDKYSNKPPIVRLALQDAIFQDSSEKIVDVIKNMHAKDPSCIHLPDDAGFRPIFVAVKSNNLFAVRTLISLGLSDDDLKSRDNGEHLTPLEACDDEMCSSREFAEIFKREGWSGYPTIGLYMKAAIERAMKHPMPPTDDEYVAQKKWGCTCDKCYSGWLSPRTLRLLQDQAEMAYDTVRLTIQCEQMVPKVPLDAESIEFNPILPYIPLQLWPQMYQTFILGYGIVMKTIAELLSRFILPTESTVLAELGNGRIEYFDVQAAKFYFGKGGRVEYALDAIIDLAEEDELPPNDAVFLRMPCCANDRELGIVRKHMVGTQQRMGPYSALPRQATWIADSDDSAGEEEGGEEDEEEDEDDSDDEEEEEETDEEQEEDEEEEEEEQEEGEEEEECSEHDSEG